MMTLLFLIIPVKLMMHTPSIDIGFNPTFAR